MMTYSVAPLILFSFGSIVNLLPVFCRIFFIVSLFMLTLSDRLRLLVSEARSGVTLLELIAPILQLFFL